MNRIALVLTWLVLVGVSIDTPIGAQVDAERTKGVLINDLAASHPASAYIDQSTLMVAEISWSKIDVDAFFSLADKLTGDRPTEATILKDIFAKLDDAGAGNVFVVAGLQTLSDGVPLVVIPTHEPEKLLESLRDITVDSMRISPAKNAVLLGTTDQLDRFAKFSPVKRDEILTPLRDANRLDHTAVIVLPELTRELLGKIWPQDSPPGFPISSSPGQLALDTKRLVLTLRTPPDPEIRLTIDAVDDAAADRITKAIAAMKQRLGEAFNPFGITRDKQQVVLSADRSAVELFSTAAINARREASQADHVGTLRKIGIAIHTYDRREKHFPPRCFVDPSGDPLHSWLVAILPDFEQLALYRTIQLGKQWDDSANEFMKNLVPAGIGNPGLPIGHTVIRAPVFPGSLWHGDGPPKTWKDITDKSSATILLADAPLDASIHWADPAPWVISASEPMKDFFGDRDSVYVLMVDGAVMKIARAEMTNEKLKAMLTIAGGD